ncbi:uncharacterized protein BJ212DRAFT_1299344 [Suillus subaureus]|uniref:Uncharacterized protein n=1 Tax=Suillus subaureus TaxID=48587 RepID=A0A9P7JE38_9AGAM|nr:uncharacterized protein BJ212DRAFT_1299344 [Suillus subaureus]KAG1817181.1 hypothetical protein BJ212DRAFT_1299344 [Suillus subaureus]
MLWIPLMMLRRLKMIYIDGLVNVMDIRSFTDNFSAQAKAQTTMASVIMAVNASILAVPGVLFTGEDGQSCYHRKYTKFFVPDKCFSRVTTSHVMCSMWVPSLKKRLSKVATHPHGCCIDHTLDHQCIQLTLMATMFKCPVAHLIQDTDSWGYQVVQYILDLNNRFSDVVICQFTGNVYVPSVQKFNSNVIEKLQWEQANIENLSFHAPYGMMLMGNSGHCGGNPSYHGHGHHNAGAWHIPQGMHPTSVADVYAQGGLYGIQVQGSYSHSHLGPKMHGLQACLINGHFLQGTSPHSIAGYANVKNSLLYSTMVRDDDNA